ncbi:hypothetical protein ACFL3V_04795 [Nanoarchaeota archaeon]
MQHSSSFNIIASILILIGIILMLDNFSIMTGILFLWPVIPLVMGIGFTLLFFKSRRRDLVLLGIGTCVVLNSLFFIYLNLQGWATLAYLWPVFLALLGLTFFACHFFAKTRILIYLAVILIALGVSFILIFAISTKLWPITLILAGISFIIINIFKITSRKGLSHAKKK